MNPETNLAVYHVGYVLFHCRYQLPFVFAPTAFNNSAGILSFSAAFSFLKLIQSCFKFTEKYRWSFDIFYVYF